MAAAARARQHRWPGKVRGAAYLPLWPGLTHSRARLHVRPRDGCRRWRFATAASADRLWLFGGHRLWHGFHPRSSVDNDWSYTDEDFPLGGYMNDLWSMDLGAPGGRGERDPGTGPSLTHPARRHGRMDAALRRDRVPRRVLPRPAVGEASEQLLLPGSTPRLLPAPHARAYPPDAPPHYTPPRCGLVAAPRPPWPRQVTRSTSTRGTAPCFPTPTRAARVPRQASTESPRTACRRTRRTRTTSPTCGGTTSVRPPTQQGEPAPFALFTLAVSHCRQPRASGTSWSPHRPRRPPPGRTTPSSLRGRSSTRWAATRATCISMTRGSST